MGNQPTRTFKHYTSITISGIRVKAKQEQEHKLLLFDRQIFYLDM